MVSRSYCKAHWNAKLLSSCGTRLVKSFLSREEIVCLILCAALKFLPADTAVPWQRVIGSSGAISSRGPGTDGAQRQREALEAEGVEVAEGRGGELKVDLRTYGWFPASVEGEAPEEDNEEDADDAQ